jgi:hypothetical protein
MFFLEAQPRYHREQPKDSRVVLPDFMGLHPRGTLRRYCDGLRRLYSLYKHDQSQRKARTATVYQGTVCVYWYLDMKKPVSNAGFVYAVGRAITVNHTPKCTGDCVKACVGTGERADACVFEMTPREEVAKYVPSMWCKRVVSKPEPVEPCGTPRCLTVPMEIERKPRRISGNLSRAEMERVLMSEESIKEITGHVAKMLHIYSIQQQGGTQEQFGAEWSKESKWGKREMDDIVMSFVVGRKRDVWVDKKGKKHDILPTGLQAIIEDISLDGRKRNLTRTFQVREPFRFSGGKVAFIAGAATYIAKQCKNRKLWWNFRDTQMTPTDQNAVRTEPVPELDLDRLYMSKRDEETAAWDRMHTDERLTAFFSDDDVAEETQRAVSHSLFDDDDESVTVHGEWMYSRSGEPLPFNRMVDRYNGPPLVNVPWWER